MKKIYLFLCILGTVLPYYNLYKFLELNNWSMEGFWGLLYENYAVSMISYDLSVAALTFLIYIVYKYRIDLVRFISIIKIFRYLIPFFVGFSLALPFYLYDTYESN